MVCVVLDFVCCFLRRGALFLMVCVVFRGGGGIVLDGVFVFFSRGYVALKGVCCS